MRKMGMCVIETLWSHSSALDSMEPRTSVVLSSPSSTALNEALFYSATCRPFGVTCVNEHVKIYLNLLCESECVLWERLHQTRHSTLRRNNALDQSSDFTSWTKTCVLENTHSVSRLRGKVIVLKLQGIPLLVLWQNSWAWGREALKMERRSVILHLNQLLCTSDAIKMIESTAACCERSFFSPRPTLNLSLQEQFTDFRRTGTTSFIKFYASCVFFY